MAIGSAPEIGYEFTMWSKMDEVTRAAWFTYMRENWGDNLYAGEASIVYPDPVKRAQYCSEIMEEVNAQNIQ